MAGSLNGPRPLAVQRGSDPVVSPSRLRRPGRALAVLLALLHGALALGAGRHAGAHVDDSLLDRLPAQYHHHAHAIAAAPEAPAAADAECVACHLPRIGLRLAFPAPDLAVRPLVRAPGAVETFPARSGSPRSPGSRAPPSV